MPIADYYQILGISQQAEQEEIRKAYKKQVLKWHPDKNLDKRDEAKERFQEISEAHAVLSNPEKKQKYDNKLMAEQQQGPQQPSAKPSAAREQAAAPNFQFSPFNRSPFVKRPSETFFNKPQPQRSKSFFSFMRPTPRMFEQKPPQIFFMALDPLEMIMQKLVAQILEQLLMQIALQSLLSDLAKKPQMNTPQMAPPTFGR